MGFTTVQLVCIHAKQIEENVDNLNGFLQAAFLKHGKMNLYFTRAAYLRVHQLSDNLTDATFEICGPLKNWNIARAISFHGE